LHSIPDKHRKDQKHTGPVNGIKNKFEVKIVVVIEGELSIALMSRWRVDFDFRQQMFFLPLLTNDPLLFILEHGLLRRE
jgi:hypothetical protein